MTSVVAVIDTNVVVSGVVTRSRDSSVVLVLEGMRSGAFEFLLSAPLLGEYREILLRPKLRRLHQLPWKAIDEFLDELISRATWRTPGASASSAPDPDDQHLWDLLADSEDAVLVTGDKLLLSNPPRGTPVLLPKDFLMMHDHQD